MVLIYPDMTILRPVFWKTVRKGDARGTASAKGPVFVDVPVTSIQHWWWLDPWNLPGLVMTYKKRLKPWPSRNSGIPHEKWWFSIVNRESLPEGIWILWLPQELGWSQSDELHDFSGVGCNHQKKMVRIWIRMVRKNKDFLQLLHDIWAFGGSNRSFLVAISDISGALRALCQGRAKRPAEGQNSRVLGLGSDADAGSDSG